jgi:hypothetical protein
MGVNSNLMLCVLTYYFATKFGAIEVRRFLENR